MNDRFRLLVISNYPSETRPAHQVFVRALLLELASLGVDVTVIAPESLWNISKARTGFRLPPALDNRDGLTIHRPRYLTYSHISLPMGGTTARWGINAYAKTVLREVEKLSGPFDLCLGHFLYPQGFAVAQVGLALGIPTMASLGESSFSRYENTYSKSEISQLLSQFSGVISNSPLLSDYCIQKYGLSSEKTRVFPNGVDEQRFYPRDRQASRQHCKLPADRPIILFVGQFIERKGPLRILEAIKSMPEIGAVFLGYGPQVPQGPQVLFQGEVPHDEVPLWYSSADAFVLPTLNEGCSNAILEALACGLPVISSDRPFNKGILDEKVSILVDPQDVHAIEQAILAMFASAEHRAAMSEAALQRSASFRLAERARNILAFMQQITNTEQKVLAV